MTLLERFDSGGYEGWVADDMTRLRRALAVAQAVDEFDDEEKVAVLWLKHRADELIRGGKDDQA